MADPLLAGSTALSPEYGLYPMIQGIMMVIMFFIIGLYVYLAIAHMKIANKAKLATPGVAWASPLVVNFEIAKMHWWPWPAAILGYLLGYLLILASATLASVIMFISITILVVMSVIWQWKTFEAVGKPGVWSIVFPIAGVLGILSFIISSFIGAAAAIIGVVLIILGLLAYLIFVGMAAWG